MSEACQVLVIRKVQQLAVIRNGVAIVKPIVQKDVIVKGLFGPQGPQGPTGPTGPAGSGTVNALTFLGKFGGYGG